LLAHSLALPNLN